METLLWFLKLIIGPVISIIVTLIASEPLKNWLAPFVSRLGSRKDEGVRGRWLATFYYGYGPNEIRYTEAIEISTLVGVVVGRIVPHPENHTAAKKVERNRPLRLRGSVKDNRFFTGIWFHPNRRSHYHGAFELVINQDNEHMNGMWLGYSETENTIESGKWTWSRVDG